MRYSEVRVSKPVSPQATTSAPDSHPRTHGNPLTARENVLRKYIIPRSGTVGHRWSPDSSSALKLLIILFLTGTLGFPTRFRGRDQRIYVIASGDLGILDVRDILCI